MRLTPNQVTTALDALATSPDVSAASYGWSRRLYAPFLFERSDFASLRRMLRQQLPDYAPVFDVLFEAPAEQSVDFHVDYESLGPFVVGPSWVAVDASHFVSVHFNLTPHGGALRVLPWPRLSFVAYHVIVATGIYSTCHRLFNVLCAPLFWCFAKTCPNTVGHGNVFDNMRLHSVGPGARPRVSYVVRLVRRGGRVHLTRASLEESATRGPVGRRLREVFLPHLAEETVDAATIRECPS